MCRGEFNETTLLWYVIPWVISVHSTSKCPIFLSLLQSGSASSQNTRGVAPYPNCRHKSALWTSVPVCIMDDIAEGRSWVPGRDNEPPFSRGKCGEALVTSISNLTKSETDGRANVGPCWRPDVDGSRDGVLGNRFTLIRSSSVWLST